MLGSVGVDGNGLEGLELFYEAILRGTQVPISSNRDAMGRRIFRDNESLVAFKDGQSLILTIDKAIQYESEKILKQAIEERQAKAGTVIVAEVENGEILAMANYPAYNPNSPKLASAESKRNRAITDSYEPGSTFKPFIVAQALERGKKPGAKIYCEKGVFKVGDRKISEAEAHEKFEWLTLGEILKFSSNIGAAKLAIEIGSHAVSNVADKLGVGKKTGIDLPGEASGQFSTEELNSIVRLANVGFGHGLAVTPLQMLTYYLAIANGGRWVQPKMVKAILSEDPDSLERGAIRYKLGHRFDTTKSKKVFSPDVAAQVSAMLETVVQEKGTATAAQLDEWPVAGKTGTAQKIDAETHRYSRTKYMSSFVGFAPAKDPRLVALVVLDEPQRKYYAGETAAPAFREIMRASLLRQKIPPQNQSKQLLQLSNKSNVEMIDPEATSAISKSGAVAIENEQDQILLPDLRGSTMREAIRIISSHGVEVEVVGSGLLREQNPPATQWVARGSKVRLIFQQPQAD